jgi:hypothetical protein
MELFIEKFNWSKAVGFGVLIWIVMFVFVSLIISIGVYDYIISAVAVVLIAGIIAYMFSSNAKPISVSQAISYGLVWVITGIVLDLLITLKFNAEVFSHWEYWASYAFIFIAPMINIRLEKSKTSQVYRSG